MTNYISKINANSINYIIGGNIHDGKWVDKCSTLIDSSSVSGSSSINLGTSYLPSTPNPCTYEVLFVLQISVSGSVSTSSASELWISTSEILVTVSTQTPAVIVGSATTKGTGGIFGLVKVTKNSTQSRTQVILPITYNSGTANVYYYVSNNSMSGCQLYAMGYRRLGTNE